MKIGHARPGWVETPTIPVNAVSFCLATDKRLSKIGTIVFSGSTALARLGAFHLPSEKAIGSGERWLSGRKRGFAKSVIP